MRELNVKTISPLFDLTVRRVGIVARDYNVRYPNGYRDFSHVLPDMLALLDGKGCDTALFSLYSVIPRKGYDILTPLPNLANLKMILLEEFQDCRTGRKAGHCIVCCRTPAGWEEHSFKQVFGRVNWQTQYRDIERFAQKRIPERVFGSSCILVCGETNGVRYDRSGAKKIHDPCGVRAAIPPHVHVILNPVHDRMSRFEMMMKRRFLSEGGRWVVSVWNRGKRDGRGRTRDGINPPWTVFKDGCLQNISKLDNDFGVEVGILNIQ
jgi:hypothetical protein